MDVSRAEVGVEERRAVSCNAREHVSFDPVSIRRVSAPDTFESFRTRAPDRAAEHDLHRDDGGCQLAVSTDSAVAAESAHSTKSNPDSLGCTTGYSAVVVQMSNRVLISVR